MSMTLASLLEQAVPELLEQHYHHEEDQLVEFLVLSRGSGALRGPIIVAATLGAKRAALVHIVAEKNAVSDDRKKKQNGCCGSYFTFFFWALGMRSPFRFATLVDHPSSLAEVTVLPPQSKSVLQCSTHLSGT